MLLYWDYLHVIIYVLICVLIKEGDISGSGGGGGDSDSATGVPENKWINIKLNYENKLLTAIIIFIFYQYIY